MKFTDFQTTTRSSKAWITPDNNHVVALNCWHYEYFRDPAVSATYGVLFGQEVLTRLAALRVGFVRVNYERNRGVLTLESMRYDRPLPKLIDDLVLINADAIDLVRIHLCDAEGHAIRVGAASPHELRHRGLPVNRWTLGSWNNFPRILAPGKPPESSDVREFSCPALCTSCLVHLWR